MTCDPVSFLWPHQRETRKQASLLRTAAIHHSIFVPFWSLLSVVRRNQCLKRIERDTKIQTQRAQSLSLSLSLSHTHTHTRSHTHTLCHDEVQRERICAQHYFLSLLWGCSHCLYSKYLTLWWKEWNSFAVLHLETGKWDGLIVRTESCLLLGEFLQVSLIIFSKWFDLKAYT